MMYSMRNVVSHMELIPLPTCMYRLKNVNYIEDSVPNEVSHEPDLKIKDQIPNEKMAELEQRQDHLLNQLDILYERIKSLSLLCKSQTSAPSAIQHAYKPEIAEPAEIVINASADYLPYFLLVLARGGLKDKITLTYHIHSSVPADSVFKIKEFMKFSTNSSGPINVRLIFKEVGANTELKLCPPTRVPLVGETNVLRYLALVFPTAAPHPATLLADSLLDELYLLQRSATTFDKVARSLFDDAHYKGEWILGEQMSIVDMAAFSAIKQVKVSPKLLQAVPKVWFEKFNRLLK